MSSTTSLVVHPSSSTDAENEDEADPASAGMLIATPPHSPALNVIVSPGPVPQPQVGQIQPFELDGGEVANNLQVVLHDLSREKMVLFVPGSKRLVVYTPIQELGSDIRQKPTHCPYCKRPMPSEDESNFSEEPSSSTTAPNYFRLLQNHLSWPDHGESKDIEYDGSSVPETNPEIQADSDSDPLIELSESAFNTGYYARFFKEKKLLGSGGFGAVYLCLHVLDGAVLGNYALKKVPVGDNREWLLRILREVRSLERLQHPNIVDYKHSWLELHKPAQFGPRVPCLFILMEYANLGNITDFMERLSRSLTEKEIWKLFADTCLGLHHLHHHGILHRDLKPENLLLVSEHPPKLSGDDSDPCESRRDRARRERAARLRRKRENLGGEAEEKDEFDANDIRVLISDFGQSENIRAESRMRRTGQTGTLMYCAPELLICDEITTYDEKCDIWSLGCALYFMAFGRIPFEGCEDDTPEVLQQKFAAGMTVEIPEIHTRPKVMCDLIKLCTRLNPEERPTIDDILSHASIIGTPPLRPQATPVSVSSTPPRPARDIRSPPAAYIAQVPYNVIPLPATNSPNPPPRRGRVSRTNPTEQSSFTVIPPHPNVSPLRSIIPAQPSPTRTQQDQQYDSSRPSTCEQPDSSAQPSSIRTAQYQQSDGLRPSTIEQSDGLCPSRLERADKMLDILSQSPDSRRTRSNSCPPPLRSRGGYRMKEGNYKRQRLGS